MNDFVGKMLSRQRVKAVMPFIEGRLLDIGCGINRLVKAYGDGIGVDIHDWGEVDCVVKDASHLPYNEKEFDTITIVAALNHITNREDVLKECHRLLSDDGKLIITMLNPGISKIWHKLRGTADLDLKERGMGPGEVFGFSKKDLIHLVIERGFKLKIFKKFMGGFNSLYVFTKE
jgi:SAM-dependent methyltransferase